jgi:hypothetical protein
MRDLRMGQALIIYLTRHDPVITCHAAPMESGRP